MTSDVQHISTANIRSIAGDVRDIKNLMAVFEEEYDLPAEIKEQIDKKLDEVIARLEWSI